MTGEPLRTPPWMTDGEINAEIKTATGQRLAALVAQRDERRALRAAANRQAVEHRLRAEARAAAALGMATSMTGIWADLGGRVAAQDAADRLKREHPAAEVRTVRRRDGEGLEAVVGGQRVVGTISEVEEWLGERDS